MRTKFIIFGIILFLSLILLSSPVMAAAFGALPLEVNSTAIYDAVAQETNMSVKFNITVTNPNSFNDVFEINSIMDMDFSPSDFMDIGSQSSITVPVEITPSAYLKSMYLEAHSFAYYVRGLNSGTTTAALKFKIVPLADALKINVPATVKLSDKTITVTLENKENMWLSGKIVLKSDVMSGSKDVTMEPFSRQDVEVPITTVREKAGKFLITISFKTSDYSMDRKDEITLEPSTDIRTDETKSGSIFLYQYISNKTNIGNIEQDATITIPKTIFSSWFTTFSQTPEKIDRKGMLLYFSWTKKIDLDETFSITAKTDYSLPLTILFIVLVALIVLGIYFQKQIIITKRTFSRIKTSMGGFALKVLLHVKCIRGEAMDVNVTDILPIFASLHEKTANPLPDRKIGRSMTWHLGNMIKGETKTITYVLYSGIKIVGKIELPDAKGSYRNKKGSTRQLGSNRVFILAEEMPKEE